MVLQLESWLKKEAFSREIGGRADFLHACSPSIWLFKET